MKQYIFYLSFVLLCFTSCNNAAEADKAAGTEQKESKEDRNIRVVTASLAGFNNHDPDAMFKEATKDAMDYADGNMPPMPNNDSTRMMMKEWFTAFPDMKADNSQYFASGNKVLVLSEFSGTWKGDFMGQKPSNKSFKYQDVDIFTLNDEGKITEHRSILNQGPVMSSVGVKIPE
jgi:predicted ester cyclase